MRILAMAFALCFVMAMPALSDDEALTEEQVEGVQKALRAIGCTVPDDEIEIEGDGYEADDVICKDGQYDAYLDKDFNITNKVKE